MTFEIFLIFFFSYGSGSIPFGLILTKLFLNQDIRDVGSKNIGATNVLRTGNKFIAGLTLLLDIFKGVIPVIVTNYYFPDLIYLSGLRISEALNLKWSDINHQDNSIYIYGKGSKERKVYIIKDFLELLKNLGKKNQFVFALNNKKISARSVNKFLENCHNDSIIKDKLSSHIFRHSFATTMLENNADIRHIQKLLGHSSISTTEIYTKVAKSMKKRVLDSYHPLKNKL